MGGAGPDIVTTYGYNAKGLMDKVVSPRGNVPGANPADFTTTYIYDGDDNLVRMQRPYPGGQVVTTDVKVDQLDRTTATVDERNKTTSFVRDNVGIVTASTDTLGRAIQMGYDKNGRQTSTTDANKQTTGFTYDEAGNKIRQTMPEGGATTWAYDGDGLLISTTDPRGNVPGGTPDRFTTRYRYDGAGNPQETIDPLGHVTQYRYDVDNRLTSVTDARGGTVRYTYTVDDQVRSVLGADAPFDPKQPEANATVYTYDPDGLVHSVRDPLGHATSYQYDRAGRVTVETDPLGRHSDTAYDVEGDLVSTITLAKDDRPGTTERAKRTIVDTYDIVGRRRPGRQARGRVRRRGPDQVRHPYRRHRPGRDVRLRLRRAGQRHRPHVPGRYAHRGDVRQGQPPRDGDRDRRRLRRRLAQLEFQLRRRGPAGGDHAAVLDRAGRGPGLRRRRPADRRADQQGVGVGGQARSRALRRLIASARDAEEQQPAGTGCADRRRRAGRRGAGAGGLEATVRRRRFGADRLHRHGAAGRPDHRRRRGDDEYGR
ncbi:MAG: RHS repeat protein [Actinobacteria bacterium]|nr:MAG: RHS repeat protein [Actinomycetota bacterium]